MTDSCRTIEGCDGGGSTGWGLAGCGSAGCGLGWGTGSGSTGCGTGSGTGSGCTGCALGSANGSGCTGSGSGSTDKGSEDGFGDTTGGSATLTLSDGGGGALFSSGESSESNTASFSVTVDSEKDNKCAVRLPSYVNKSFKIFRNNDF